MKDDRFDQIDEKINSIDKNQARLDERLVAHIESENKHRESLHLTLKEMAAHIAEYNTQLAIHISGTQANTKRIDNNSVDIDALKTQASSLIASWRTLVYVGVFLGGAVALLSNLQPILQILHLLK